MKKMQLKRVISIVLCVAVFMSCICTSVVNVGAINYDFTDDFEHGLKWSQVDQSDLTTSDTCIAELDGGNHVILPKDNATGVARTSIDSPVIYTYNNWPAGKRMTSVTGTIKCTSIGYSGLVFIYYYKDPNNWRGFVFSGKTGSQTMRFCGCENGTKNAFATYGNYMSGSLTSIEGLDTTFTVTYNANGSATLVLSNSTGTSATLYLLTSAKTFSTNKFENAIDAGSGQFALGNLTNKNAANDYFDNISVKFEKTAQDEVDEFTENHSTVLAKTTDTVEVGDKTAVQAAITAYDALSADAKALVSNEYALLNSLLAKIDALAFRIAHEDILAKTTSTVVAADSDAVDAALTAYEALGDDAKALLTTEKTLLESLKTKLVAATFDVSTFTDDFSGDNNWEQVGTPKTSTSPMVDGQFKAVISKDVEAGQFSIYKHKYWPESRTLKSVDLKYTMAAGYVAGPLLVYYYKDAQNWRGFYIQRATNLNICYVAMETDANDANTVYLYKGGFANIGLSAGNFTESTVPVASTVLDMNITYGANGDVKLFFKQDTNELTSTWTMSNAYYSRQGQTLVSTDGGASFAAYSVREVGATADGQHKFAAINGTQTKFFGLGGYTTACPVDDVTFNFSATPAEDANAFTTAHATILAKTANAVNNDDVTAIDAALADYAELSADAKALVATEYALLTAQKAAAPVNTFKTTYATVLAKTVATVETTDAESITAALAAYEILDETSKATLATEYGLLASLDAAVKAAAFNVAQFTDDFSGGNYWEQVGTPSNTTTSPISDGQFKPVVSKSVGAGQISLYTHKYWPSTRTLKNATITYHLGPQYNNGALVVFYYKDANNWRGIYINSGSSSLNISYVSKQTDPDNADTVYYAQGGQAEMQLYNSNFSSGTRPDYSSDITLTFNYTVEGKISLVVSQGENVCNSTLYAGLANIGGEFLNNKYSQALISTDGGATFSNYTSSESGCGEKQHRFYAIASDRTGEFALGSYNTNYYVDDLTLTFSATADEDAQLFRTTYAATLALTTSTVVKTDATAVATALAAFDELSQSAKDLLTSEYSLLLDLKKYAPVNSFVADYATVLALTTSTVKIADVSDIEAALAEYDAMEADSKALLSTQHTLLVDLKKNAKANDFKSTHAGILAKTVQTVTNADVDAITAAVEAYDLLDDDSKSLLTAEHELLVSLKVIAPVNTFKTNNATILAKTAATVTGSDKADVEKAIADYNALDADTKAALATEYALLTAMLDAVYSNIMSGNTFTEDFEGTFLWSQVGAAVSTDGLVVDNSGNKVFAPTTTQSGVYNSSTIFTHSYWPAKTITSVSGKMYIGHDMNTTAPSDVIVYSYQDENNWRGLYFFNASFSQNIRFIGMEDGKKVEFAYYGTYANGTLTTLLNKVTTFTITYNADGTATMVLENDTGVSNAIDLMTGYKGLSGNPYMKSINANYGAFGLGSISTASTGDWFDDITVTFGDTFANKAEEFRTTYATTLAKTAASVVKADKAAIGALYDAYNNISRSSAMATLLATEGAKTNELFNALIAANRVTERSAIRIACVGDSITEGHQVNSISYPTQLQEMLDEKYGTGKFVVGNFGVSGSTAVSYFGTSLYKESLYFDADIVILMLGTNDVAVNTEITKYYYKKLAETYIGLENTDKFICASSIYARDNRETSVLPGIRTMIENMAEENSWIFFDMFEATYDQLVNNQETLYKDKLHPNYDGYTVLASETLKMLETGANSTATEAPFHVEPADVEEFDTVSGIDASTVSVSDSASIEAAIAAYEALDALQQIAYQDQYEELLLIQEVIKITGDAAGLQSAAEAFDPSKADAGSFATFQTKYEDYLATISNYEDLGVANEEAAAAIASAKAVFGRILPETVGATIKVTTNIEDQDLRFKTTLPTYDEYEVVNYGMVMLPSYILQDDILTMETDGVAYATTEVVSTGEVDVDEFYTVLEGSASNATRCSMKITGRAFVTYKTKDGETYTLYGNMISRSIYGTARSLATVLYTQYQGNLDSLSFTTAVTKQNVASIGDKTVVSNADVLDFIVANADKFEEKGGNS